MLWNRNVLLIWTNLYSEHCCCCWCCSIRKWTAIDAMRRQKSIAKCNLMFLFAIFSTSIAVVVGYNRCPCCMELIFAFAEMEKKTCFYIKCTIGYNAHCNQTSFALSFMLRFVSAHGKAVLDWIMLLFLNNSSVGCFFPCRSCNNNSQLSCGVHSFLIWNWLISCHYGLENQLKWQMNSFGHK